MKSTAAPKLVLIRPRKLSKHEKLLSAVWELRRLGNQLRAEMAKTKNSGNGPMPAIRVDEDDDDDDD